MRFCVFRAAGGRSVATWRSNWRLPDRVSCLHLDLIFAVHPEATDSTRPSWVREGTRVAAYDDPMPALRIVICALKVHPRPTSRAAVFAPYWESNIRGTAMKDPLGCF